MVRRFFQPTLALGMALATAGGAVAQTSPAVQTITQAVGLAPALTPTVGYAPSPAPAAGYVPSPAQNELQMMMAVMQAAKFGDGGRIQADLASLQDPLDRKIALWALADSAPESLSWQQADQARRELADWPRPLRRQIAAEKLLDRSTMTPEATIAWFGRDEPATAQGAMALAGALRASGQPQAAGEAIRRAWRGMAFDVVTQQAMLASFHDLLTSADYLAREDFLLYGVQGPAAADLLRLLPPEEQVVARARMAVRQGDPAAASLIAALPPAAQVSPGLAFERALASRERGDEAGALALVGYLPEVLPNEAAAAKLWKHGTLVVGALRNGDNAGAYAAAAHAGLATGADAADAQFYAGWIALSRLKDARLADEHFARVEIAGGSPLTQSRALYWRGRAADAAGDPVQAQIFYGQAARFDTTFYGQLAATRGGRAMLVLGHDPQISAADLARFESRETVRAARLLAQIGDKEGFRAFVVSLSETLPGAAGEAMLVDFAKTWGDQELAMRVVRNAAKRGLVLPERGYPIRVPTLVPGGAETPLVLGITRQESSFDPAARSGAGARGMMQLMPATAQAVARRSGIGWGDLGDPDYNMKLGSAYLGQLVDQFSGSYVMAAAAYNAGPGRPTQWTSLCGDPRSSSTDPLDFIECIPFGETRDYVMRVMEATQVYRARLAGGSAPITLANDLKRGAYGYRAVEPVPVASVGAAPTP